MEIGMQIATHGVNHGLTVYEVFCKALSDFLGKPLTVSHHEKCLRDAKMWKEQKIGPPYYVHSFFDKERRKQLSSTF